ncbi:hypothetical protein [Erwinia psidii]|uniref:hypothetical protein n=1 Tax=Erwinia psidii TaxID=69224 RepID=UPI000F53C96E|nr:hypothetical protein [Erwinia psidii]MCX8958485.1 hypothetical protein [Erwinia psidii]MCX8961988.1 hypothetical protein [Erwinia psidii]MCX8965682.1 hypothetical protein [Erwinia psidii]
MQGISGQNRISTSSVYPVAEISTASPGPVASFLNGLRSVSNSVMNRFTVHAAPSSPWNYDRRGGVRPTESSFSASPKVGANTTRESLKAEYKKNASEYRNNPSSFRGVLNNTSEKCRQHHYDKRSHPSR